MSAVCQARKPNLLARVRQARKPDLRPQPRLYWAGANRPNKKWSRVERLELRAEKRGERARRDIVPHPIALPPAAISRISIISWFHPASRTKFPACLAVSARPRASPWSNFTSLTNCHSKSLKHHKAMQALFIAWYNFGRRNEA